MRDPIDDPRFDRFIDRIQLTPEELLLARRAAQNVAAVLRLALQPGVDERIDHLVVGSIGKRTAIRPIDTVDLVYIMPDPSLIQDGLFRIERILRQGMPGILPIPQDHGVLVPLEDLNVFIFLAREQARGYEFWSKQGYVDSYPAAEITALRLSDSMSGGRTTRLLTLLKSWRLHNAVPLASFGLEILARNFMHDHGGAVWPDILADFFAWGRGLHIDRLERPGSTNRLSLPSGWQDHAALGQERCGAARRLALAGDPIGELGEWRALLGQAFGHQDD